jgi:hypothetical protein
MGLQFLPRRLLQHLPLAIGNGVLQHFLGVKLGETTEKDLRAKFGKPAYKGRAGEGDDEETSTYGPQRCDLT